MRKTARRKRFKLRYWTPCPICKYILCTSRYTGRIADVNVLYICRRKQPYSSAAHDTSYALRVATRKRNQNHDKMSNLMENNLAILNIQTLSEQPLYCFTPSLPATTPIPATLVFGGRGQSGCVRECLEARNF